jgi:uncharacterized membrane protein
MSASTTDGRPDNQGTALLILVLAIGSWVGGSLFLAIPALILAHMEQKKIDRGEVTRAYRGFVVAGYWTALVHIVAAVLGIFFFCGIWGLMLGGFGLASLGSAASH